MTSLFERLILAALALIGVGAVIGARSYGDGTAHGGDLMPTLAGGVTVVLAIASMFRANPHADIEPDRVLWRPWVAVVGTAAFLYLMPVLGFPIVAPVWIAGIMLLLGSQSILRIVGTATVLPVVAYYLLARLAFAPPPMGPFGG